MCVFQLGAPTAAMFFGLRLVFAVILSDPILGSTVIQTGLQVRSALPCCGRVYVHVSMCVSRWGARAHKRLCHCRSDVKNALPPCRLLAS